MENGDHGALLVHAFATTIAKGQEKENATIPLHPRVVQAVLDNNMILLYALLIRVVHVWFLLRYKK